MWDGESLLDNAPIVVGGGVIQKGTLGQEDLGKLEEIGTFITRDNCRSWKCLLGGKSDIVFSTRDNSFL